MSTAARKDRPRCRGGRARSLSRAATRVRRPLSSDCSVCSGRPRSPPGPRSVCLSVCLSVREGSAAGEREPNWAIRGIAGPIESLLGDLSYLLTTLSRMYSRPPQKAADPTQHGGRPWATPSDKYSYRRVGRPRPGTGRRPPQEPGAGRRRRCVRRRSRRHRERPGGRRRGDGPDRVALHDGPARRSSPGGERSARVLGGWKAWMTLHNAPVMTTPLIILASSTWVTR